MSKPIYTKVYAWVKDYGSSGAEDSRAVRDYMEVESREAISSFQAELMGISRGNYEEEKLDVLVGVKRKTRFGTYARWAKMMLLWMSEHKA